MATTTENAASDKTPSKKPAAGDKRYVILVYNEERGRILPLRGRVAEGSKTHVPGPTIGLIPGMNVVDAALWERWKRENGDTEDDEGQPVRGSATILLNDRIPQDRHANRRKERSGQPFIVEGPRVDSRATPLSGLDEQRAIGLVPEILDRGACAQFLKIERRAAVAEALRAQLALLDTPSEPEFSA